MPLAGNFYTLRWKMNMRCLWLVIACLGVGLCAGCGRFRKKSCNDSLPSATSREPRSRDDLDDGIIRPREIEPIRSPGLPITPRPFTREPPTRTDTFRLPAARPQLGWMEPSSPDPIPNTPNSGGELPSTLPPMTEQPGPSRGSNKFWINPDGAAPSPQTPYKKLFDIQLRPEVKHADVETSPTDLPTLPADAPSRSSYKPMIEEVRAGPTGVARYTPVRGVAEAYTGDKPTLTGLDWLQKQGFVTVIYIHRPTTDPAPARALCEQRQLKLVPIALPAEGTLTMLKEFEIALANKGRGKTYVCDDADGSTAGLAWYGYFRRVALLYPDVAQVRATALGLPTDPTASAISTEWNALK